MSKARNLHEMAPDRVRKMLEGHEDLLTSKSEAFVEAKESRSCSECGAVLKYRLTSIFDPFRKDGLPRLTGECDICGCEEELEF